MAQQKMRLSWASQRHFSETSFVVTSPTLDDCPPAGRAYRIYTNWTPRGITCAVRVCNINQQQQQQQQQQQHVGVPTPAVENVSRGRKNRHVVEFSVAVSVCISFSLEKMFYFEVSVCLPVGAFFFNSCCSCLQKAWSCFN